LREREQREIERVKGFERAKRKRKKEREREKERKTQKKESRKIERGWHKEKDTEK
jgi:hypothetical protein